MKAQNLQRRLKFTTLVIILSVLMLRGVAQGDTWQQRALLGGGARAGAVAFSILDKGYIGLGTNAPFQYPKDLWEYDPSTDSWTQKADFPGTGREGAVAFAIDGKGYVGMGKGSSNDGTARGSTDLWQYDPSANGWTRKSDIGGAGRTNAIGFSIGNNGYVGLGIIDGSNPTKDFWKYDATTDTWSQKADYGGTARWGAVGVSAGSMGYVGTGYDINNSYKKDIWQYNPITDSWVQKADFAGTARNLAVGFSMLGKCYVGTAGQSNAALTRDFWEYDPSADLWTKKADFGGVARYGASGFVINSCAYLGFGIANDGTYYNDLWKYTPILPPVPTTIWSKHPEGHLASYTYPAISSDGNGNTYVTGGFDGTLTFPTSPTPTILTSAGGNDIFVAKYDATGNVVWAKRAGGSNNEIAWSIKYDGFGSLYIAGSFTESTNFEGTIITNPVANSSNVLLAKYNATTGDFIWVRHGAGEDGYSRQAFSVTVDKYGDPYITGELCNTTTFAPLPTLALGGRWWDIFVVKYNADGVPQWQTVAGSSNGGYNNEAGNGIAVDQLGNVFVTGKMNGSSANPTMFGTIPVVSNGGGDFYETDYFLAKYNPSTSSWEWAVNGGGTVSSPYSSDYGSKVSVDNSGAVFVSGVLNSQTSSFGSTNITQQGTQGYFVAKYSNSGSLAWVQPVANGDFSAPNALKADASGNLYFAGTFAGNITVGDQNLTANGYANVYLSSWNSNGDFQWVKHIPGNYYSLAGGLDIENGNIDIVSLFAGTETFDCTTFNSVSYADLAVAKLGYTNGSVAPTIQSSSALICSGNSTSLSISNGNLNNGTDWKWYTGSCGGTFVASGTSITVAPTQSTTYYVRSEGGCGGPSSCGSIVIAVDTTHPVINSVSSPLAPNPVNSTVNLTVNSSVNISAANIDWGDGSAVQTVQNPAANLVLPHIYTNPGVYTVSTTVTNTCGLTSATNKYQYIVVYDPNGSYVTGGGWINSPAGAYRADVTLTGKANFGFESRYLKGATVPSGNTEFKYQTGNLNFKSLNYQWLVVSGSKAQFKGTGTINGSGNYGFLLSAVDGDLGTTVTPDLFRIKIWDINNNGAIVYDNQFGSADDATPSTQIGGGSIVIHSASAPTTQTRDVTTSQEQLLGLRASASPNPSSHYFTLNIQSNSEKAINIRVLDVLGREVENRTNLPHSTQVTIGHSYKTGVYVVEIMQEDQKKVIKLIKE